MAITEVSTRSIAEIDLRRNAARRLSPHLAGLDYVGERLGPSLSSMGLSFMEMGDAAHYDVLVYPFAPHYPTFGVIQCKEEPEEEREREDPVELISRVPLDAIEPFVRRTVLSPLWQPIEPVHGRQMSVQYKALTNWLRSVADNELSRAILDIEEINAIALGGPQGKVPITVSPSLQRDAPATTVGGLGHVSAGLLLWLESAEGDSEDG